MGPGGQLGAKGSQEGKKMPKVVWIWSGFEPFLAPFWDLEAFFSEEGKRMPKVVWIWPGFEPFLAPFWDLEAFFSESFFYVFFGGAFFTPWATFGHQWWPQGFQDGAKMEAKGSLGVLSGE